MVDSALSTMDGAQRAGVAISAARQRAVTLLNGIASSADAWHRKLGDAMRERTASGATAAELGRLTSHDWDGAWPIDYDDLSEACRCLIAIGFGPAAERIFDDYGREFTRWFAADAAVGRCDWTPEERERFENKVGPVPTVPETPEEFRDLYIERLLATHGLSRLVGFIRALLGDLEAVDAAVRPKLIRVSIPPARQHDLGMKLAKPKRQPISLDEANTRARDALKTKKQKWTQRKLAKAIGCAPSQVEKLPAYQAWRSEHHPTRPNGPKAVALTDRLSQTVGKQDEELEHLIAESAADFEPSPFSSSGRRRSRRPKV